MCATLTLVTHIHAVVRRPVRPVLRLSPLLRYALATAVPRADGQPNLLPYSIPTACCHDLFRCRAKVLWRIGDGQNMVFFCEAHSEDWWQAGNDVLDCDITRWKA